MLRLKTFAVSLWLSCVPAAGTDLVEVDVAIVFAVDSSTSVDPARADRQRIGHAEALRSREVISAITRGETGCIAITYFEWASAGSLRTVLPWRAICNEVQARAAAQVIEDYGDTGHGRSRGGHTSISFAIDAGSLSLRPWSGKAMRTVIDISTNGTNNDGLPIGVSRRQALAEGHVINAIALDRSEKGVTDDLAGYLRENVIGGPGAFVSASNDPPGYARALRRKMAIEISGSVSPQDAETTAYLR
ncbi:MAG TPA: DUF1194 domain-containing protein [Shinella sp.]|jgi:hypothetical protein|uniref:DUF1194 domain-containing protein n=1 Tax=Shinella sp. TaxID=1870904 RepID=UPI0029AA068F|nr:DUF1194 domain-containing protein [Shinella sp.]MDX3975529.1 DUF1194 domain-containing protein [Shinella sp.]HEV7247541.1 DUF1194 domain-containing protein [Shinella sp.]